MALQNTKVKILMVEDDMIIAADISMHLTASGYEVIGISTHAEDALQILDTNTPDLIIMDIILNGEMNGIDASIIILERFNIPVIFLTSNTDEVTFKKALQAKPYAFISKPFQKSELARTIKLTVERIKGDNEAKQQPKQNDFFATMEDRLFVRHKNEMVKVVIKDILYAEADGNYTHIHTKATSYVVSLNSKHIEAQLPSNKFVRVHRSYVVNLEKIDSIGEHQEHLNINNKQIPISRRMKQDMLKYLKLI